MSYKPLSDKPQKRDAMATGKRTRADEAYEEAARRQLRGYTDDDELDDPKYTGVPYSHRRKRSPSTFVSPDEDAVQARLERFMQTGNWVEPVEKARFVEQVVAQIDKGGGDSRDKTLLKEALKMFDNIDQRGQRTERDAIVDNWAALKEAVETAWECEKTGGTPEQLQRLQEISEAHLRRLLNREKQEGIAIEAKRNA